MSFTRKASFKTPLPGSIYGDFPQFEAGIASPCPLYDELSGNVDIYHVGLGKIGNLQRTIPFTSTVEDIPYETWRSASNIGSWNATTTEIKAFFEAQYHSAIYLTRQRFIDVNSAGTFRIAGSQLIRPSYPFESFATQDVMDPYVISDIGGGDDKTGMANPGAASGKVKDCWSVFVWAIFTGKSGSFNDSHVILQKGANWELLLLPKTMQVVFQFMNINGTRTAIAAGYPVHVSKTYNSWDDPDSYVYTEDEANFGKPVLIAAGFQRTPTFGLLPYLAVSAHTDQNYDFDHYPKTYTFHFWTTAGLGLTNAEQTMLAMPGEPLTVGNDWTGGNVRRLRCGAVISAAIKTEDHVFYPSTTYGDAEAPVEADDYGLSVMQKMISLGPYLTRDENTYWLINASDAHGNGEIKDTAGNAFAPTPCNVRLEGDTTLREYFIDDSDNPEQFELHYSASALNVNAQGHAYLDIRVIDGTASSKKFWENDLSITPNGEIAADDEEDDSNGTPITIVLRRRDASFQEQLTVYGYEDLGRPANLAFYERGRTPFIVIRLYVSSNIVNSYPVATADATTAPVYFGNDPFIYRWNVDNRHYYKGIYVDYVSGSGPNYFSYGRTLIPNAYHTERVFYVGYDGTYYSLMEDMRYNRINLGAAFGDSQRRKPIYRSARFTKISHPVAFRFEDDLYIVFTEVGISATPINKAIIRVLYKRANTYDDWSLLPLPLLATSGDPDTWDGVSIAAGGLLYNANARQAILTYAGYNGTDRWRLGKVNTSNLLGTVSDSVREDEAIAEDEEVQVTVEGASHLSLRPVSQLFKHGDKFFVLFSKADNDEAKYYIGAGLWEPDTNEYIGKEEFEEFEEYLDPADLPNKVRALHKYYKRNGQSYLLVAIGNEIFRGRTSLDSRGQLTAKFEPVDFQTDVPATQFSGTANDIFFATFQDWCYAARKGDLLTKYAGGLLKRVGIVAPILAPTGTVAAGGTLADGNYQYKITYISAYGESNPSAGSTAATTSVAAGNQTVLVNWAAVLAANVPGADITGVKIYRSLGGAVYVHVHTIDNLVVTQWNDTGAASAVATGAAAPSDHDPPPYFKGVIGYQGLLVGWLNDGLYWSKRNSPEYWPSGNVIRLDSNGEEIIGCAVLGHMLVVFTSTQIFALTAGGVDSSGNVFLAARKTRAAIGAIAPKSIKAVPWAGQANVILFLAPDKHVWAFTGEDAFRVSTKINRTIDRISKKSVAGSLITDACAEFWDNHYILCAPFKSNVNNAMLTLDVRNGAWTYHSDQHLSCVVILSSPEDGHLLLGGDSRKGYVYQVFDESMNTDDGVPIVTKMRTKSFDMGVPETDKRIRKLYYDFEGARGVAIITTYVDNDTDQQEASIPGYTLYLSRDPNSSIGTTLSDNFAALTGSYGAPGRVLADPAWGTANAFQARVNYDIEVINVDNDRYIPLPAKMVGKTFAIEIKDVDSGKDFKIDSLSLAVRSERVK